MLTHVRAYPAKKCEQFITLPTLKVHSMNFLLFNLSAVRQVVKYLSLLMAKNIVVSKGWLGRALNPITKILGFNTIDLTGIYMGRALNTNSTGKPRRLKS